jgi:Interferon-induced transmembrane protein
MTTQTPPHHTGFGPESAKSHRYPPPPPPKPSTYWPLSIISFLCSFIFGGFGMYFSAQVTSRWDAGDVAGARKASKTALIIDIIGIFIGLLVIRLSFVRLYPFV